MKTTLLSSLLLLVSPLAFAEADFSGLWFPGGGPGQNPREMPLTAFGKKLFDDYVAAFTVEDDPGGWCVSPGLPRSIWGAPFPVEIVQTDDFINMFWEGYFQYRKIYFEGRPRPEPILHTRMGYSVGHWEGDTLVVETVGYNTAFWFERAGLPHTESAKTTEYFTRRDARTLDYRFVLDDPLTYDAPVEGRLKMNWRQEELFEYVCQQSNYAPELMVGDNIDAIGRSSIVVP